MVPLSLEVFLGTLEDFNRMVRPMQALAAAFGLVALWVLVKPQHISGRLLGVILAASWAAAGFFYHLSTFAELNFWDYPIGLAFLAQSALLFWVGAVANKLSVDLLAPRRRQVGLILCFYALAGAPLLALALGRSWAEAGYFALSPGPTILFTVGALLMLNVRGLTMVWILPTLMAVPVTILGFSLKLWEDAAVLPLTVLSIILLVGAHRASLRPDNSSGG